MANKSKMVSSISKSRRQLVKSELPEHVTECQYDQNGQDRTRDEKFPIFTRNLYLSAFPAPLNAMDRRIDDDKETDPNNFLKCVNQLGSGRLGKSYAAQRVDMARYAHTFVPKRDVKNVVVVTKMDAKRVDYIDAVRAVEPFMLPESDTSPFLCKILLCFRTSLPYLVEHYYIVSQYWQHAVSLCHRLQKVGRLNEDDAKFYITELIEGVACVHKHGKILRRLCLCNLLIEPTGHLKLVPYTMCQQNLDCGQSCNMLVKNCGDQFYASPEIVFGMDVQCVTDWWSVGVILYQLLTGELPFTGRTLGDLGKAITESPFFPPEFVSGEATAFLKHILHKDPRRRLGFSEAVSVGEQGAMSVRDHPFFQQVLWRSVRNTMLQPPFIPPRTCPPVLDNFRDQINTAPAKGPRQTFDGSWPF